MKLSVIIAAGQDTCANSKILSMRETVSLKRTFSCQICEIFIKWDGFWCSVIPSDIPGEFNKDGNADLAIGIPKYIRDNNGSTGGVIVIYRSSNGLSTTRERPAYRRDFISSDIWCIFETNCGIG